MVKGINVEITLRNNTTGEYLRIPVVPPTIPYMDGKKKANTVEILNLGDVDFPSGVELDRFDIVSFFPARYDAGYCNHSNLLQPLQYRNRFSGWKEDGTGIQVIIPAAGINKEMYVGDFTWELKGFEGDIYYTVSFTENKKVRPQQIVVSVAGDGTIQAKPEGLADRPSVPEKPAASSYTVQSGDNLTVIAKKLGIADWKTLYEKNKGVIGSNPNKILPGQVLTP